MPDRIFFPCRILNGHLCRQLRSLGVLDGILCCQLRPAGERLGGRPHSVRDEQIDLWLAINPGESGLPLGFQLCLAHLSCRILDGLLRLTLQPGLPLAFQLRLSLLLRRLRRLPLQLGLPLGF